MGILLFYFILFISLVAILVVRLLIFYFYFFILLFFTVNHNLNIMPKILPRKARDVEEFLFVKISRKIDQHLFVMFIISF